MTDPAPAASAGSAAAPAEGPVVAVAIYAGISELELGAMVTVCRLCGGEGVTRTVNRSRASIVTAGGLVMTPQVLYAALPEVCALLLPGGPGAAKAARDPLLRAFLGTHAALPTGASGSGLLMAGEGGLLRGREVGGPPELEDSLWGYDPASLHPGEVRRSGPLTSAPGGLGAVRAALAVAAELWGEDTAADAARRLGA